jgi:hypothetical protein
MNSQLANQIARSFNTQLFHSKYCRTARADAQSMLIGKTHYVDDNTLRYFGARITSAQQSTFGLFYKITESVKLPNGSRAFRTVLFDLNGEVVYRPDVDEMHKSSAKAEKAFYSWFESLNPEEYYKNKIQEKINRKLKDISHLEESLKALNGE